MILATSEGIFHGNLTLADIFYLVGVIVFAIAFVVRLQIKPLPIDGVLIAAGLTALALGLLVM